MGPGRRWPGPGIPDSLHAVSEPPGHRALRRTALADPHPRVCAAAAGRAGPGDGCADAEDRTRCSVVPRRRSRHQPWHVCTRWRSLHHFQSRLYRCGRPRGAAQGAGQSVRWPDRDGARPRAQAEPQGGAAGSGAHRHAVRAEAGRAPAGAAGGSAGTAGDRPAGGRGPRLQGPPRHRPVGHGARGMVAGEVRRRHPPGRQHADPAVGTQRLAGHRQGTDADPQVQRDPLCLDSRGALRQAHDPGGVLQPGLPGAAWQPGDPWRRRRRRVLVRSRPRQPDHRAGGIADRHGEGAVVLRPASQSGACEGASRLRAVETARDRPDRRRRVQARAGRTAGRDQDAGHGGGEPLPCVCGSGASAAGPRLSRERAAGRGPERADRHVAVRAGLCRSVGDAHGEGAGEQAPSAVAGRHGGHRRARRRCARRGRQPQCVRTGLQPRGGSAATGGVVAQAVRLPARTRAARRVFACQLGRRLTRDRAARQEQALDAGQFGPAQPRHRAPGRCAGAVVQPGHRPRGHEGRTGPLGAVDPRTGRHPGRAESGADPRVHRPEPVCDGAAVPVPGVRWRDPAAARGAWRARSERQAAQALRQDARAGAGRRFHCREPDHRRAAAGGVQRDRPAVARRWPWPPAVCGQDRHQQRWP